VTNRGIQKVFVDAFWERGNKLETDNVVVHNGANLTKASIYCHTDKLPEVNNSIVHTNVLRKHVIKC